MAEVNEGITRKVADLARLELTDDEVTKFTTQMQNVLNYIEQLGEVMTDGVEPLYQPLAWPPGHPLAIETPLREDVVVPPPKSADGKPKIIEHAPSTLYEGFKVPPIL